MWFWYALISSVLGAVESIITKRTLNKVDPTILTWAIFFFSLPLLGYLAFKDGLPHVGNLFFLGAIGSALAFSLAKTITNHSISKGTLSKLIPLSAFSVLFTYVLGLLFLSETISIGGITGLTLIIIGVYILNAEGAREDLSKPIKILFANKLSLLYIFALFLISIESIFIKTALNNSFPSNVVLVMFAEQSIMTVLLTIYLFKSKRDLYSEVRVHFWKIVLCCVLYALITYLSFYAFTATSVALVQGVKRSQLLFTLILGILFLHDRPTKHTWIASVIMIIGVVLIKISS